MTVFEDVCSGGLEGRNAATGEWGTGVGGATVRECHPQQTHEDVRAAMRPLAPGEVSTPDSLPLSAVAADRSEEWRLWIRILDQDGHEIREVPFTSTEFRAR